MPRSDTQIRSPHWCTCATTQRSQVQSHLLPSLPSLCYQPKVSLFEPHIERPRIAKPYGKNVKWRNCDCSTLEKREARPSAPETWTAIVAFHSTRCRSMTAHRNIFRTREFRSESQVGLLCKITDRNTSGKYLNRTRIETFASYSWKQFLKEPIGRSIYDSDAFDEPR